MKSINYTIYSGHLGDENTEEMNKAYVTAVKCAIEAEYPDSTVEVEMVCGTGYRNGYASGFDDEESVMENAGCIASDIWGQGKY